MAFKTLLPQKVNKWQHLLKMAVCFFLRAWKPCHPMAPHNTLAGVLHRQLGVPARKKKDPQAQRRAYAQPITCRPFQTPTSDSHYRQTNLQRSLDLKCERDKAKPDNSRLLRRRERPLTASTATSGISSGLLSWDLLPVA